MTATIAMLLGGLFGSLGRHHQGGASHRWIGVLLYTPIMLWVAYTLLWADPTDLVAIAKASSLVVGWYVWLLMKETFGNLWHSTWRYGGPVIFACVVTQFWWALPMALAAWAVVKWAKGATWPADPHRIEEFLLGGIYGAVWAVSVPPLNL